MCLAPRHENQPVLHLLDAVLQHRAVDFGEDVFANVDAEVGGDAEDVEVVGGVVDLAEGEAVGDLGEAALSPACRSPEVEEV